MYYFQIHPNDPYTTESHKSHKGSQDPYPLPPLLYGCFRVKVFYLVPHLPTMFLLQGLKEHSSVVFYIKGVYYVPTNLLKNQSLPPMKLPTVVKINI